MGPSSSLWPPTPTTDNMQRQLHLLFRDASQDAARTRGLLLPLLGATLLLALIWPGQPAGGARPGAGRKNAGTSPVAAVFSDVTTLAGITATHHFTYLALGQAWGDYDNDGWLDLYLTDNSGPNSLYRNNGDGTFSLSPLSPQVALPGSASGGALFGDYDNDGWDDLYVLADGPNSLFHNDGGSGFSDVSAASGAADSGKGETAAWGDYDQDGFLDLYVTNWECEPCPLGSRDGLYHNNGDGTFSDVTEPTLDPALTTRFGFVASWVDYDNDGDLDLYLVNDKLAGNVLWRNDGPGCPAWCFTDVSAAAGAGTAVFGMGLATGDYDGDADLDFYFSNLGPMKLLQNQTSQGSPTFLEVSAQAGVDFEAIGWGTVFLDYDNDGRPDLYLVTSDADQGKSNRLYHNLGDGTFADASAGSGADSSLPSMGLAYADYDADGRVDLVVGNRGVGYALLRNLGHTGPGNHWFSVELSGGGPVNRDAIGSRVVLEDSSGRQQLQEVKSGSSLGAGNMRRLHFGLGAALPLTATVVWPDGRAELFGDLPLDSAWALAYPQAALALSPGQTAWAAPGAVVTLSHVLGNNGNRPDAAILSAAASAGSVSAGPVPANLEVGGAVTVTLVLTLPSGSGQVVTAWLTATSGLDPQVQVAVTDTLRLAGAGQVFAEVSQDAGISTTHHATYLATGQAWGDYDADGWPDLYLTDNDGPNTLYRHVGGGLLAPSPLSASVALSESASGGASFADYDNDGWPDLYVLNWGPNALFHNEAGAGFVEVAQAAGVADAGKGETAAWGDYDQDGFLDLYVVNWLCDTCPHTSRDSLFHNNGDGTFTDVTTATLGLAQTMRPGFVASFLDYDNDGDPDLYLVNDKLTGNVLWRNDGPGCGHHCFTDVSAAAGAGTQVHGMGLAVGDYDLDGDLDLYFSNGGPMVLLQNQASQGSPTFLDVSAEAGVDYDATGWGTVFLDYDHDGWPDLYLASMSAPPKNNRLFHNLGNGTFADVSSGSGADDAGSSMGLATSDYDRDGWVDFVLGNWDEGYHLYRNLGELAGQGYGWLAVRLVGQGAVNRDAVGARVTLSLADGRQLMQEVKNGSSLGAGNDLALYFGLGQSQIAGITIRWPGGLVQQLPGVAPNQELTLSYPLVALSLSPGQAGTAPPGGTARYSHAVTNLGLFSDTISLAVTAPGHWAAVEPAAVTLAPGISATVTLSVTVPATAGSLQQTTLSATSGLDPAVWQAVIDTTSVGYYLIYVPRLSRP